MSSLLMQEISIFYRNVRSFRCCRARKVEEERLAEKKRKEEAKKALEEEKKLFRPVVKEQVIESGVDPKSIFCAFFKQVCSDDYTITIMRGLLH